MLFLPAWSLFLSSLRQTNVDEWSSYGKQSDETFGAEAVNQVQNLARRMKGIAWLGDKRDRTEGGVS